MRVTLIRLAAAALVVATVGCVRPVSIPVQTIPSQALANQIRFGHITPPPAVVPVTITLTSMPSSAEDVVYPTQTVTVTGGTGPYTCALASGTLPTGITETAECVYGGTPTTPGTYPFTLRAVDTLAAEDTQDYSIIITAAGGLPSPWSETEIGTGQDPGDCVESSGTWTVTGAGVVYNTADQHRFCYQSTSGDKEIIARVTACTTGAFQCGVIVRGGLTTNAVNAYAFRSEIYPIAQWRQTVGAATGDTGGGTDHQWVRLVIHNNTAYQFYGDDGTNWVQMGSGQALALEDATYYIGLSVNSNATSMLSAGTFTNVSVADYVPPEVGTDFNGYRPHFQGYGATAKGGNAAGTRVIRVNTLTDDASGTWGTTGSLRDAWEGVPAGCTVPYTEAACSRVAVFDVSGKFLPGAGGSQLAMTVPYLTIAGQTAPSCGEGTAVDGQDCDNGAGGVSLERFRLLIDTHNVVVQHIRCRRPPASLNCIAIGEGGDGGSNAHVHDVILDHVSVSWADEDPNQQTGANNVLPANYGSGSILITHSIMSEPLWGTPIGGINVAISALTTFAYNAMIHGFDRNPIWGPGKVAIYNNLIFNGSADLGGQMILSNYPLSALVEAVITNNQSIAGPQTGTPCGLVAVYAPSITSGSYLYLQGNSGQGITGSAGAAQWTGTCGIEYDAPPNAFTAGANSNFRLSCSSGSGSSCVDVPPTWWVDFNFQQTSNTGNLVRDYVIAKAGARPLDRDATDARVLGDVTDGGGDNTMTWAQIVSNYGGMPPIATRTRTVTLPSAPGDSCDCGLIDADARTNLWEFLERDPAFGADRLEP